MTFDYHAMVQPAVPLPGGERSDRACAIRVRGISFTNSSPLTRNGREAPIPTSPLRRALRIGQIGIGMPESSFFETRVAPHRASYRLFHYV